MIKKGRFLFLGTGGSSGVPMIGCSCQVCMSEVSKNKRMRSSGLITLGEKTILIDAGPEFRLQALSAHICRLSAVLLTHAHADHIAGLDDLRAFYFLTKQRLPCFLSEETLEEVRVRYHYFFTPITPHKSMSAQIDFHLLSQDTGSFEVEGIPLSYFSYFQTQMKVTGFRVGNFAYVSDIREYSESVIEALKGIDLLVLSALRHAPSLMHFSIEEAIHFARKVGAKKTYLTHISHDLDHETTNALLPSDVRLGYDGLELHFDY